MKWFLVALLIAAAVPQDWVVAAHIWFDENGVPEWDK